MSREERFDDERGNNMKREEAHGSQRIRKGLACAACKYFKRKCGQECGYSPYFSPHDAKEFDSVHKIFGGSNFLDMIEEAPDSQRAIAAESLVHDANMRLTDPVFGCTRDIFYLLQQIQSLEAELNAVREEIILRYKLTHDGQ